MPKSKNAPSRLRRSHTFGGCSTCRRRHVKCDQVRPSCLTCQAVGVACEGYHTELKWMATSTASSDRDVAQDDSKSVVQIARTHLYTEDSRASMSTALLADLSAKPVDESLSELDARSKDVSTIEDESIAIGPFGVFSVSSLAMGDDEAALDVRDEAFPTQDDPLERTPQTVESAESMTNLQDWLDWPDLFELDFNFPDVMMPETNNTLDENDLLAQPFLFSQPESYLHDSNIGSSTVISQPHASVAGVESISILSSRETDRLQGMKQSDAQLLLKHFQQRLIPLMAPLPLGNKSAWEVTHVNSAILTLAKSTYMSSQHVSNAATANLQAICAIAANHLALQNPQDADQEASRWQGMATQSIKQAKENLQRSLRHETQGPNASKYKDQLMAISAVMTYAILYDQQREARAYMVDAERLLRLRGLVKQNVSRKSRLLHHCYTWTRIIGESTYVLRTYENAELIAAIHVRSNTGKRRKIANSSGVAGGANNQEYRDNHNPRLDDFLRLEPNIPKTGRQVMDKKDRKAGLQDIHLEDSREWSEGLYIQLYGISETWLSLVSQTTRLANVLDSIANSKDRKAEIIESLDRRKSRLENMVCSLISNNEAVKESDIQQPTQDANESTSASAQACMVRALNSALVIYFYRRIRNVNPWILQEHVNNVIKALKDFAVTCAQQSISGPGTPWPCFMAGCEAMTEAQRKYLTQWLDTAIESTGFTRFQNAKLTMIEVWKQRDRISHGKDRKARGDVVPSWIDVLRDKKMTLLLS